MTSYSRSMGIINFAQKSVACYKPVKEKVKVKHCFLFGLLFFIALTAMSQVILETGHSNATKDGALIVYGSDNLRKAIPYESIRGNAYWNTNWMKAFLFNQQDTPLGSYKARFNFVTGEVHYIDHKGSEQVAIPGTLNAIVFMRDEDTTQIATVFKNNIPVVRKQASCKECFIQELNQGETKLLKITQRLLKSKDSLFGTLKSYYFYDQVEYFIQHGELYDRVKRLSRDVALKFVVGLTSYEQWISKNNINFRKEEDFVRFLVYYNQNRPSN